MIRFSQISHPTLRHLNRIDIDVHMKCTLQYLLAYRNDVGSIYLPIFLLLEWLRPLYFSSLK